MFPATSRLVSLVGTLTVAGAILVTFMGIEKPECPLGRVVAAGVVVVGGIVGGGRTEKAGSCRMAGLVLGMMTGVVHEAAVPGYVIVGILPPWEFRIGKANPKHCATVSSTNLTVLSGTL